jgi:hypothetical protein
MPKPDPVAPHSSVVLPKLTPAILHDDAAWLEWMTEMDRQICLVLGIPPELMTSPDVAPLCIDPAKADTPGTKADPGQTQE